MISIRRSDATEDNERLKDLKAKPKETNAAWLKRAGLNSGVILLGGAAVSHFRIRVAQSHVRSDLLPSYWSLAGILIDNQRFYSVPLDLAREASEISRSNGVQLCNLKDYDDPAQFPNVAVIRFTTDDSLILDYVKRVQDQRAVIDLPTLMLPWLSFIWIAAKAANPLIDGLGVPSAAFVETVYGAAGIELTPGLASATSCPEAIWQAAKWWHGFYEKAKDTAHAENAIPQWPAGSYALRQRGAAATWPPEILKAKQTKPI
jgi:hypothetical protein